MVASNFATTRPATSCRVQTLADVAHYRASMISTVFGTESLPSEVATLETVTSPVADLTGLASTRRMVMSGYTSRPRIWVPTVASGDAIIVHQGHTASYTGDGYPVALQAYLNAGFAVCGLVMVGGANETTSGSSTNHNTNKQPLSEFLGPVAVAVNTLIDMGYETIHMTGLSGGGWTTITYTPIDPRIEKAFPTAGFLPLHHPVFAGSILRRDWEQFLPGLSFGYYELMAMSASNGLCKQILHDQDSCCFTDSQYRIAYPYATEMAAIATGLGGRFEFVMASKGTHEFDATIIASHILPEIT